MEESGSESKKRRFVGQTERSGWKGHAMFRRRIIKETTQNTVV